MRIKMNGETLIAASMYLLIIYLCLPISMTYLNSVLIRVIVLVSTLAFVAGMAIMNKWKQLAAFAGLFVFTILFWAITWRVQLDTISFVYYCFASLTFVFGGMALYSSGDETMLKRLFIFLTVIYFITAITTILGLNVYPLAARELARGSTYDTSLDFTARKNIYRSMNIASWSQIYGMLFAIPASLFIWKKKRNLFFLVFCVVLGVMMVFSQITFAVLLAIALVFGMLILRESTAKTVIASLVILIIALLVLINLEGILNFAVQVSNDAGLDFLSTKLGDLQTLLLYRNAVGDASSRGELYGRSFDTFLHSPIAGLLIGGKAGLDNIGYHSDFLDMMGTFGLVGLIVMIISVSKYFSFLRRVESDTKRELMIIMIGFLVLFVLNPVFNSPQIFAGAFLYSMLADRFCRMEAKNKKKMIRFRFN